LPESWIPPGELRDQRELLRTSMALRDLRTSLKHRIHSAIDRYGLHATGISDPLRRQGPRLHRRGPSRPSEGDRTHGLP